MKKIKYIILICTLLLTGCTIFKRDNMENINIITTIYPLEYSTNYLYGDSSIINSIYPDDTNTDTYELTEKQRKCLTMYYRKNMNTIEISKTLKICPSTVWRHIKKAKNKVKDILKYSYKSNIIENE